MNIVVNAAALRSSGALSIYLQFIGHLPNYIHGNKYFIFVDPAVECPIIDGVTYIKDGNHSWMHRIRWEHGGLKRWLKKNNIIPDKIVSLQNTGVAMNYKQLIYYHQSLPFYPREWNLFNSYERKMWLYKNIYPFFVKSTLNSNTDIVVQIPYIKKKFIEKFNVPANKVHVLFPDVEKIDKFSIPVMKLDSEYIHFIYPAISAPYKEHKTLCEALRILKERKSNVGDKIRIHLTVSSKDSNQLNKLIQGYKLKDTFIFEGRVPHAKLLSMYNSCHCLLFPSTIETLGLPLLEAAAFGLPILVSNLDYAHEVLNGYSGGKYINPYDYDSWADAIESICFDHSCFEPFSIQKNNWKDFFDLIEK